MAEKPIAILHPNQTMNTITNRNTRGTHRGLPTSKMIIMRDEEDGRIATVVPDRRRNCIGIMMMWIMIRIVVGGEVQRDSTTIITTTTM